LANSKQAKKRILMNEKKRLRNKTVSSSIKTAFKKAIVAVLEDKNPGSATQLVKEAIRKADKAVSKGMLHKNTAARKKSRLMKKLNALQAQQQPVQA